MANNDSNVSENAIKNKNTEEHSDMAPIANPSEEKTEEAVKAPEPKAAKTEAEVQENHSNGKKMAKLLKATAKVVAISRTGKAEVDDISTAKADAFTRLSSAQASKTILTGKMEGAEFADNVKEPSFAVMGVVNFEGVKVHIPAAKMWMQMPKVPDGIPPAKKYFSLMSAMLGAEIDFLVVGTKPEENFAYGDRVGAMVISRKDNYFQKFRNGTESRMEIAARLGRPVESRVIAVAGSTVHLEIFGVEASVKVADACWRYTADLSKAFFVGQRVLAKIKDLSLTGDGNVQLSVSIKEATENILLNNIKYYKQGSIQSGTVSGKTEKGFFVSVGDAKTGIDVYCKHVMGEDIPQIGDTVACTIGKIYPERGSAAGKITRILKRKEATYY